MNKWKRCMDLITNNGGAVMSNKALRKYFRIHYCKDGRDKSYVDLADIYGQIVSQGLYFEEKGQVQGEDEFFYTDADFIADELCLPVRRVRDLIAILVEMGLLKKKTVPGKPNKYAPNPSKFEELTKDIMFEHREMKKIKKYKDKYEGDYEIRKMYDAKKGKDIEYFHEIPKTKLF
jgi:hypothetical protein